MLRHRIWIAILAMLAVLTHGAALVRHHGRMLAAELTSAIEQSSLAVICRPTDPQAASLAAEPSSTPEPRTPTPSDCPICAGAVPGFTLTASAALPAVPLWTEVEPHPSVALTTRAPMRVALPPARGPPTTI